MTSTVYRQTRSFKRIAYAFTGIVCSLLLAPTAFADESEQATAMSSTDEMRAVSGELGDRASLPGAALFATHCASCHNGQVYKAPHTTWLEMMPARSIYRALDGGLGSWVGAVLAVIAEEVVSEDSSSVE